MVDLSRCMLRMRVFLLDGCLHTCMYLSQMHVAHACNPARLPHRRGIQRGAVCWYKYSESLKQLMENSQDLAWSDVQS